jgi:hypothetical protein
MKHFYAGIILLVVASLCTFTKISSANDYGGWFAEYSYEDCFTITNLESLDYNLYVTELSRGIYGNPIGTPQLVEAGKCYDSKFAVINQDGKIVNRNEFAGFLKGDFYVTYFDLGFEYEMFNFSPSYYDSSFNEDSDQKYRQALNSIIVSVDNDFGTCDMRKKVSSEMSVGPDGYLDKNLETWTLKNDTVISPPNELSNLDYSDSSRGEKIARAIGCVATYNEYKNGKTQKLVSENLTQYGFPPKDWSGAESTSTNVDSSKLITPKEKTPSSVEWWWPLAGAIILAFAWFFYTQKGLRKK